MSEPLLVIGNGMATARFVDELAIRALGRYAVAVIGEEPRLAYNRVLLSSVLAGEIAASDISLKPASWWSDRGVTLCYGAGTLGRLSRFRHFDRCTASQEIGRCCPRLSCLDDVAVWRMAQTIWEGPDGDRF